MNDRTINMQPGSTYIEHIDQQNIYPQILNVADTREVQGTHADGERATAAHGFATLVTLPDKAEAVMTMLHALVDRQSTPRDVVMPIRAAMEAGAIGRPTWNQFCAEFGDGKLSSKSLLSKYTEGSYPYGGNNFTAQVNEFRKIMEG